MMTMDKDIGRIVKFDKRDYLIVNRLSFNNNVYVYLLSINSPLDVIIAREKVTDFVTELIQVDEEDEKKKIYNMFLERARLNLL